MLSRTHNLSLGAFGSVLLEMFCVACSPAQSPTATPLPTAQSTVTSVPSVTSTQSATVIDACGVNGPSGRVVSYGFRETVQLPSGEQKPYCVVTLGDNQVPERIRGSVAILANIPETASLLDRDGKKMEYLGVKDYAFTWRKSEGSLLILPIFYPRQIGNVFIAPVLIRRKESNQNSLSDWEVDLVRRDNGKPLAILNEPFSLLGRSQTIRVNLGGRTDTGEIPPQYEVVDTDSTGKPVEISGTAIGYPLRVPTTLQIGSGGKTIQGFFSVDGRQFPLTTSSFFGSQVGILGEMPVEAFVDEHGEPLSLTGVRGFTFTWRDSSGRGVVLPAVYPDRIEDTRVAPVFLCKCENSRLLVQWQVRLISLETSETVKIIDNPFVTLDKDEDVVFNDENGYLEILKLSGGIWSPTNRRVGLPLPSLQPVGVVEGMRLYRFLKEDVARFQNIVNWMKSTTPNWYQFLLDQQPFDSFLEPQLGDLRWAGSASCCWLSGIRKDNGRISFQKRPPINISDDLWYVVTFVHEATHIRDRRAKNFEEIKDRQEACRASERSAVESQRAFLADLLNSNIDAKTRAIARDELQYSDEVLAKGTFDWNPRCR